MTNEEIDLLEKLISEELVRINTEIYRGNYTSCSDYPELIYLRNRQYELAHLQTKLLEEVKQNDQ